LLKLNAEGATSIDIKRLTIDSIASKTLASCKQQRLEAAELLMMQTNSRASLARLRPIQTQISNLILDYNERVATILIGLMVVATFFYLGLMLVLWGRANFVTDKKFNAQTRSRLASVKPELRQKGAAAVIQADFSRTQRRLIFAKNIGPICGFALTVSSLIAALHPAVQVEKDSFSFLSSLQLALVATLLGLAMRVLAEFAIRFHRRVSEIQLELASRG
jgi:hypothetical protein